MAIPALRFKALDQETNVGVANFLDIKTADIFTSPNNELQKATDSLKGLLGNITQALEGPMDLLKQGKSIFDQAKSTIEQASGQLTRATQDIFSAVKDITGLTPKQVEAQIASLLPNNPVIQNAFNKLASQCRTNSMSRVNPLKFKDKFGCGSGKGGKCDSYEVNGLLNKLTNGALGKTANKISGAINSLLALAGMGYDVGLCKVFGSLVDSLGLGKMGASRGASVLLGQLASMGNVRGIIDVASQTAGLFPLLQNPGAIGAAVSNYALGAVTGGLGIGREAANLFTRFDAGMEIMQDGWRQSEDGSMGSLSNMGESWSADFGTGLTMASTSRWPSMDGISEPEDNDLAPICAAYDSYMPGPDENDPFVQAFTDRPSIYVPSPLRDEVDTGYQGYEDVVPFKDETDSMTSEEFDDMYGTSIGSSATAWFPTSRNGLAEDGTLFFPD